MTIAPTVPQMTIPQTVPQVTMAIAPKPVTIAAKPGILQQAGQQVAPTVPALPVHAALQNPPPQQQPARVLPGHLQPGLQQPSPHIGQVPQRQQLVLQAPPPYNSQPNQ